MTSGYIALPGNRRSLSWSVAQKSKVQGQSCGDGHMICQHEQTVMLAICDGSGSGKAAADCANICLKTVAENCPFEIRDQFLRCHNALKGSRGAALGVLLFDMGNSSITWAAVGDIRGILVRASSESTDEFMVQRGGVLGLELPALYVKHHELHDRDLVVLTSDGFNETLHGKIKPGLSTCQATKLVMDEYASSKDDSIIGALSLEYRS